MSAHTHAIPEPGCYRCELGQDEADAAEEYRATLDALVAGYRVRVLIELRHGSRGAHVTGSTFTDDRADLAPALGPLTAAMLTRVLATLDRAPDA